MKKKKFLLKMFIENVYLKSNIHHYQKFLSKERNRKYHL